MLSKRRALFAAGAGLVGALALMGAALAQTPDGTATATPEPTATTEAAPSVTPDAATPAEEDAPDDTEGHDCPEDGSRPDEDGSSSSGAGGFGSSRA
jgi:hypothetical protein